MPSVEFQSQILNLLNYLDKRPSNDCFAFNCPIEKLIDCMSALRDQLDFDLLVDATAIDWDQESPRYSVVYHLYSTSNREYLRIVSNCSNDTHPQAPSVSELYPAADWHERETFDLFGIHYTNHPNLKRILMWDEYPYHPLRKDFPLAGIPTDLPAPDVVEVTGASVKSAPLMGGPFVSSHGKHTSGSEPKGKDQSWTESDVKPAT